MEDYIFEIKKYLPIEFEDEETKEFIEYLTAAYLENIANKKYQFAFTAFHMLYMSFIYKIIWFLKHRSKPDILKFVFSKKDINNLFDLSLFNETESVEAIFKNYKFHKNDLDKCMNHIKCRNHCLHASGKVEYDEKGIDYLISDELRYTQRLQNKLREEIKNLLIDFLEANWNNGLLPNNINKWIVDNYLSQQDLEIIKDTILPLHGKKSDNGKIIYQKILYLLLINEAQRYIEPEENIFISKLPMLMDGLVEEIELVDNEGNNILNSKTTQRVIEEEILPVIENFTDSELKKAQEILRIEEY